MFRRVLNKGGRKRENILAESLYIRYIRLKKKNDLRRRMTRWKANRYRIIRGNTALNSPQIRVSWLLYL